MKICLFVCIETDDGLTGWGEAFTTPDHELDTEAIIQSLARKVMALDDVTPQSFRDQIAVGLTANHVDLYYASAVSAIEIALWDLLGKSLSKPVYQLLGGAVTERIPVYANTWDGTVPEMAQLAERCGSLVKQGYRAVKIYPLKYGSAEKCGECVKIIRQTVGNDVDIMLDLSAINDPTLAIDCAREVASYHPYWFEEPHSGDDLETLSEIRRQTGLRIVTGEKHAGKAHFGNVLSLGAADILNPDIAGCGGILETLDIGTMAHAKAVTISPHCWNSMTVALTAMLHVCAVMSNAEPAEIFPGYVAFGETFARVDVRIEQGSACLGDSSGLGVEIDRSALAAVSDVRTVS